MARYYTGGGGGFSVGGAITLTYGTATYKVKYGEDGVTPINASSYDAEAEAAAGAGRTLTARAGVTLGAFDHTTYTHVDIDGAANEHQTLFFGPNGPDVGSDIGIYTIPGAEVGGAWSVVYSAVREYVEVEFPASSSTDAPPVASVRFGLEVVPGSSITYLISCGPSSKTVVDVGAAGDVPHYHFVTGTATARGTGASAVITRSIATGGVTANVSVTGGSASGTASTATASAAAQTTPGTPFDSPVTNVAAAGSSGQAPCPWSLDLQARAMDTAYPQSLTATIINGAGSVSPETLTNTFTGSASVSATQLKYLHTATVNGTSDLKNLDRHGYVSASLTPASLTAAGEDERQSRLAMRGWTWPGLTLSQAASTSVDDGTSLTPAGAWAGTWAGGGTGVSVAVVAGAIEATVGSSPTAPTLVRAFTQDVSLSGYRYLRVRVKADSAGKTFSVVCGGKTFGPFTAGNAVFADKDVDLCAETGGPVSSSHDTRWPVSGPFSGDTLPISEGVYFGVGRCSSVTFTGLAADTVYTVDSLTLVRLDANALVDYLPRWERGYLINTGTGQDIDTAWAVHQYPNALIGGVGTISEYFTRRFLLGMSDGRQGIEAQDSSYTRTTGGESGVTSINYGALSISGLATEVNRTTPTGAPIHAGWSATALTPVPVSGCDTLPPIHDCFLNASLASSYLYGAGALWTNAGGWSYGQGIVPGTVTAQFLVDSVMWYPGWGGFDPPVGGSGPDFHALTFLRGGTHGLAFTPALAPAVSEPVTATDTTTNLSAGTGTTNGRGYARTGSPFARPARSLHVTRTGQTSPFVAISAAGRYRSRFVLYVETQGIGLSVDIAATGRVSRAGVADGVIVIASASTITLAWESRVTGVTGTHPCIRYERTRGRLYIAYEVESGVSLRYSDTEGGSVSVPVTITSAGTWPTFTILASGLFHYYWRTASGAIAGKVCDATGTQLHPASGTLTVVASGVADDQIDSWVHRDTGFLYIAYRNGSGEVVTVRSVDGGKTFA